MKKFSFLFAFLLSLVGMNANAQGETAWALDTEKNLITSVEQFYSPYTISDGQCETEEEVYGYLLDGKTDHYWHSVWWSEDPVGSHYLEVEVAELPEVWGFTFTRRNHANGQIVKWGVYAAPSREASKEDCTLIAMVNTPFGSQGETISSPVLENNGGYSRIRFYCEENNRGNYFFHLAEFAINPCKEISAVDAAKAELIATYQGYYSYVVALQDKVGDVPGTYGQQEFDAFQDALLNANDAIDGPNAGMHTAEELRAMKQAIIDTYEALLASYKAYIPADGYYFIKSALTWTETLEDGAVNNPTKAMYANADVLSWKTLDTADCTFLWKLNYDQETGAFQIVSAATDGRWAPIATSAATKLDATLDPVASEVTINPWLTDEEGTVVNIRTLGLTGTNQFAHCGGHGGGAGKSGSIVGWSADADASLWRLQAVSDEEAQALIEAYEPIKNHDKLVSLYKEMKADAQEKLTIAHDSSAEAVIKNISQMTFHVTESTEGSEAAILDGDPKTYWHSVWSSNPDGAPYIIVDCKEDLQNFHWSIVRRSSANDHVSKMNLYGSHDGGEFTECVMDMEVGNASNGQSFDTEVDLGAPYRYVKFEVADVVNSTCKLEGAFYCHFAEFQMYKAAAQREHTQYETLGALATDLEALLAEQDTLTDAQISIEHYNALKTVYEAFTARFVDPTALRETINANSDAAARIVIGKNPGEWSDDSTAQALAQAIEAAKAYDNAAVYTEEKSAEHIQNIESAVAAIAVGANQVDPAKWYTLSYGSEEEYTAHNWNKTPGTNENLGDLFSCIVAPAALEETSFEMASDILPGQALRFVSNELVDAPAQIAFRFVPAADGKFAIQHTSGLYIDTNSQLSLHPALFDVAPVGYGRNIIHITSLSGEEQNHGGSPSYLHAQNAGHLLVSWAADAVESNSALHIQEVDVNEMAAAVLPVNPNGMQIWTLPVDYAITGAEMYELEGKKVSGELIALSFHKVAQAQAGQPYLIVVGDPDNQDDDDEGQGVVTLVTPANPTIVTEAGSHNGMIGTYEYAWAGDEGTNVVVRGREHYASVFGYTLCTAASTDVDGKHVYDENSWEGRDVCAWTGYIDLTQTPDATTDGDLVLEVEGSTATAIRDVLNQLAADGKIYTVDGRYVGNGNFRTLQTLGRGIYIINGVRVAVK